MLHRGSVILERYEVHRLLSRGAMGLIYQGQHRLLGRQVAIKVLKDSADEATSQRFMREAKVLAQVQHPNIVSILDFGFVEGHQPCIVMELLEGQTMEEFLLTQGAPSCGISWPQALELICQLLSGLDALHSRQILHRDIKSSNIIVARGDHGITLKLVDLGIARGPSELGTRLTRTGMVMGSPAYMAPELLSGQDATVASELYAAGLVFYEALCGELPFGAHSFTDVMRRVDEAVLRPQVDAPSALLEYLCEVMLAQQPAQRPAQAKDAESFLLGLLS